MIDESFEVAEHGTEHLLWTQVGRVLRGQLSYRGFGGKGRDEDVEHPYRVFVKGWPWIYAEVDEDGSFAIHAPRADITLVVATRDPEGGYAEMRMLSNASHAGNVLLGDPPEAPENDYVPPKIQDPTSVR